MRPPSGIRWWEFLPEIVLATGLLLFAATEPSAARSGFRSSTAVALMALAAVTWVVGRIVLMRYTRLPGLRLGLYSIAAIAVLGVVVLPAYDDTTVVETLPAADASPSTTAGDPTGGATTTTAATESEALRSSVLQGIDHRASGTAVLYRQPDGSLLVGLEDIDIQPGPDYDVYVVPGASREDLDGATRLDDLRGNKGTQYYEVPAGVDVASGDWTVLVWCETFDVPIAGATPT